MVRYIRQDESQRDKPIGVESPRCPVCGAELDEDDYRLRHYSQLGCWSCPSCKSAAPALDVVASNIREVPEGFLIDIADSTEQLGGRDFAVNDVLVPCTGLYMVYNLLAVRIATALLGCPAEVFRDVVATFDPKNGRLQEYAVGGRAIMTNMAKNPVGFNQNIHMALKYPALYAVAFLMDDMVECNGDYSWVDGIEFSMLRSAVEAGVPVFYGGEIADPLDRALSAAQITAERADTVADVLAKLADDGARKLFVIANYHALERVCAELDRLQATTKQS
ncbi:MurT ligase domain-containing protein [Enorma phocaeensis]|uniref:MurT ligase domain-containing protein n=1 Tax=Enorma phocaeensis TaxID=1871019 RepID=A0A921IRT1_9ACTN|nr:MurT ligase domain-containing protein [Enorma phocaeensis]